VPGRRPLRPAILRRVNASFARRGTLLALAALAAGAAILLRPGGAADPLAWTPPAAPRLTGPYARNTKLAAAERIELGEAEGPEDIAFSWDGALYTGVADGRILRLRHGQPPETFVDTGGRPLGLRFAPDGRLFVADARRGLLAVAPDGQLEVVAGEYEGRPFGLPDDLDITADGTVYFTDATTRTGVGDSVRDVVEQHATGRLFRWRAGEGVRLLRDGLSFANGVALSADESYLVVAETARYRLTRCLLRGDRSGTCEVMVENLPGFPDGVTRDRRNLFWVALVAPRNGLLDRVHPHPALKRALLRLPEGVRPEPPAYGFVLALDEHGRVAANFQDPAAERTRFVTNVVEHGQHLYLGSLGGSAVARLPRPDWRGPTAIPRPE
jgi:sugar lactone lactonase YvrE